ncbi:MAG: threonine/serine exporter family protein, partial [Actinomycetaceae bacterium]|nr:threonine/serine exporter family protein [Actinomycetaceae bacterium]
MSWKDIRKKFSDVREENEKKFHSHNISLELPAIKAEWDMPVTETSLLSRASVLTRIGQLDLESGTGAFHVELMLKQIGELLAVRVRPNVMLNSLEATFADKDSRMTEIIELPTISVSTRRIWHMEYFCDWFSTSLGDKPMYNVAAAPLLVKQEPDLPKGTLPTLGQVHAMLDAVEYAKKPYQYIHHGFDAAMACASFTFLLGGGLYDMIAAFFGAFVAQNVRTFMSRRHYTQYVTTAVIVLVAGFVAIGALRLVSLIDPSALSHDTAYIGAMLTILPTLPFLTGGMDVAKLDHTSAIQRWTHALVVMTIATMAAWGVAATVDLKPEAFPQSTLPLGLLITLRIVATFTGVYYYSMLWNSPKRMALVSASIAAIANTARLELIDLAGFEPVAAAFVAATIVGLLASAWKAFV